MPKTRHTLTSQIQNEICAFITAGGFPQIAAEAAGVPREVFKNWLEWGKKSGKGPYKKYRLFVEAVLQAVAQSRLTAEIKAHDDEPLRWLQQGPGKETSDSPGWSTPVKPSVNHTNNTINLLLHPEMQSLFAAILQVLAPYPEARRAVSEALAGVRKPPKAIAPK